MIDEIYKADSRLVELADILLETSKAEGGGYRYAFYPANIADIFKNMLPEIQREAEKKNIRIQSDIAKELPPARVDVKRMESAMRVFLENAVAYTPPGGTISVSLRQEGNAVLFSVMDTGIGISKEDIPYLFERFFRTHRAALMDTEGSGLGLYIAKSIIERHGGSVGIESKGEDMGSRFWFSLPIAR